MKRLFLTLSSAALCLTLSAQEQTNNEVASEHIEATIENVETLSEVYGLMVCRLNEEASSTYQTGAAEIDYADLKERVEASTEELTVENGDETITVVLGPSVTPLDDNQGSEPPALLENESALDYLNRLETMVSEATDHQDFLIIATIGGEFGIVYTRVQADDEANSIEDVSDSSLEISLFPNPTDDQVTVTGLPTGNHLGQVIDAAGKMVMELTITNNEQLDISNLASGFYTLKVLVDDKFQMEKFQIKK